jgi:hypothetical protein
MADKNTEFHEGTTSPPGEESSYGFTPGGESGSNAFGWQPSDNDGSAFGWSGDSAGPVSGYKPHTDDSFGVAKEGY